MLTTAEVEARVGIIGRELLAAARERKTSFWARERWEEGLLRKLMENELFRIQALRFVDVLPALKDDEELVRHVREYFGEDELPLPGAARWGIEHARGGVAAHLMAGGVRGAIQGLAGRFIGGSNIREASSTIDALRDDGMAFTLDLLGEATVSEVEAADYKARYLSLLQDLDPRVRRWRANLLLDTTGTRHAPRLNLSVKVSSLYSQLTPVDPKGSVEAAKERLRPILRTAKQQGSFICLDMEQYDTKDLVLRLFKEIAVEPEFSNWPDFGIALQAYLRETEADLQELIGWAKRRGTPVTVRLVRGAYWDYETVLAQQHGWVSPVWIDKADTDLCYERCLRLLFENHPHIEVAVATHNVRSLALAAALAEGRDLRHGEFEFQMLYGMADPLKDAIAAMGHRVRVYVPFGELLPGMSYLVRRLLENTASQSFLRMGFAEDVPADELLAPPARAVAASGARPSQHGGTLSGLNTSRPPGFQNEPVYRFTGQGERDRLAAAIETVRGQLGQTYPLYIKGHEVTPEEVNSSENPAKPSEVVGWVGSATQHHAEAAIRAAAGAFPAWRALSATARTQFLLASADRLRARRAEFAAWEIFEAGKTWREADADVTEAIDFLEYYSHEAIRLSAPQRFNVAGETNEYFYQPRGVGVVISPWNFPLAILTGMLSATLVTGNTAVVKPSERTPVIAAKLIELLREAGLPPGVVNFVPGPGHLVGEYLVRHPQTHLIAFTGSKAVGTRIAMLAAEIPRGQQHMKRVITELGGKNAIIVDRDADVDDAVLGTIQSAFGFQGQKCSAASRVIVVGDLYDTFVRRMVEAARSLKIGSPEDPGNFMGPVIDQRAKDGILRAIEEGKKVATLALETDTAHLGEGHWVGPTIFTDVPPDSTLAQEEIFGPVVALMRAATFEDAINLALDSSYALTGGVYSRSPENLDRARDEFRIGNLYLNRKTTGAVVGRQPFGGFKLSGVGSKAGGPDYLLQFMEPRTVTENTLRRGFAPAEE